MIAQTLRMACVSECSMGSASQDSFSSRLSAALEANRCRSRVVPPSSASISGPDAGQDEFENRLETAMYEAEKKRRSNGRAEPLAQLRVAREPDDDAGAPVTEHSPDLQTVIDAWPTLSPSARASIIVTATAG